MLGDNEMIYVRDDDVILESSSWPDAFGRFRQVHNWIRELPGQMIHVPAMLVNESFHFPEAIEYIREETKAGFMQPQFHGMSHIDYGKLPLLSVVDALKAGKDWMNNKLGVIPSVWYTPWGASQDHLHEAAAICHMALVDCDDIIKFRGRYGAVQRLKDEPDSADCLKGLELFTHWWDDGARVKRVVECVKHGGWNNAVKAVPELFK